MRIKNLQRIVRSSPFYRHRHYGLGLAIQKGLPILLVPLCISFYGKEDYANFVLFYTLVQLLGTFFSLGVPQVVVPLWYRQSNPDRFLGSVILLLIVSWGGGACLLLPLWRGMFSDVFGAAGDLTMYFLLIIFLGAYIFNALGVSVVRSVGRPRLFFWSVFVGGVVLALGLYGFVHFWKASLFFLILAHLLMLVVSTLLLLGGQKPLFDDGVYANRSATWRQILTASFPLLAHGLLVNFLLTVDKWAIKARFSDEVFTTYIINFQFAFSILFVPSAIVLFYGPVFSKLAANHQYAELISAETRAKGITALLTVGSAFAAYFYAWMAGVELTWGYWLLCAGFVMHGLYLILSSRQMAVLKFKEIFLSNVSCAAWFLLVLAVALISGWEWIAYLCWLVYALAALVVSQNKWMLPDIDPS